MEVAQKRVVSTDPDVLSVNVFGQRNRDSSNTTPVLDGVSMQKTQSLTKYIHVQSIAARYNKLDPVVFAVMALQALIHQPFV
jgi:hypothetical protein